MSRVRPWTRPGPHQGGILIRYPGARKARLTIRTHSLPITKTWLILTYPSLMPTTSTGTTAPPSAPPGVFNLLAHSYLPSYCQVPCTGILTHGPLSSLTWDSLNTHHHFCHQPSALPAIITIVGGWKFYGCSVPNHQGGGTQGRC